MSNQVWKFHNDVDTDQIIASQYLLLPDVEEMKQYTFESLDPDFARKVHEGDLVVAGENFGCGSSREQAPSVLKALGVKAVIAKSYARIFYRNSINIGFPVIVCKELYDHVENGDTAELDLSAGTVTAGGETFSCTKLPAYMQNILSQGGLIASLNKEPIPSGSAKQDGSEIEHPTDFVRNKHAFTEEPITSVQARRHGYVIEQPTDLVRYKHAFIEEEA